MSTRTIDLGALTVEPVVEPMPGTHKPDRHPYRSRGNKLQTAPFIAWDGEGYSTEDGDHHYMLFGNSEGEYIKGTDLGYVKCFELLLNAPAGNHVIYGGDYDVIMMTKDMPFKVLDRLLKGKPVRHNGYRMEWFRRKYFKLSHKETKRAIILYDVLTFFSTSFVKACREYLDLSEADLDRMHQMKLRRDTFTPDDPAIIAYWQNELAWLVDLMERLRELLTEVGIRPTGWHGPGAVASSLLRSKGISSYIGQSQPDHIVDLAERAYYGGRFEQFKVGHVYGKVYEYDIRSAYPKAITHLPSLAHVEWQHEAVIDERTHSLNPYGLYCVSWKLPKHPLEIGVLPWRTDKGNVFYPLRGHRSWYWGIEVLNLVMHYTPGKHYRIHEAYIPTFHDKTKPFAWVQEMYDARARMKAEGNPAQLALKLGMNSLYGKLAQSKGAKKDEQGIWHKPRWHQIIWAGWITAYTRHEIYEMARRNKMGLVAIETDAVFVHRRELVDIDIGTGLGQWERTELDDVLYVQSGVYYALRDGVWKLKSRGVEADANESSDYWLDIFRRLPDETIRITASIRRFGTVLRSDSYARWYDYSRSTTLPFVQSKRIHYPPWCLSCQLEHKPSYADQQHYLIVPPEEVLNNDTTPSMPYALPWRNDVEWEWPKEWVVRDIERGIEEVEWHNVLT